MGDAVLVEHRARVERSAEGELAFERCARRVDVGPLRTGGDRGGDALLTGGAHVRRVVHDVAPADGKHGRCPGRTRSRPGGQVGEGVADRGPALVVGGLDDLDVARSRVGGERVVGVAHGEDERIGEVERVRRAGAPPGEQLARRRGEVDRVDGPGQVPVPDRGGRGGHAPEAGVQGGDVQGLEPAGLRRRGQPLVRTRDGGRGAVDRLDPVCLHRGLGVHRPQGARERGVRRCQLLVADERARRVWPRSCSSSRSVATAATSRASTTRIARRWVGCLSGASTGTGPAGLRGEASPRPAAPSREEVAVMSTARRRSRPDRPGPASRRRPPGRRGRSG